MADEMSMQRFAALAPAESRTEDMVAVLDADQFWSPEWTANALLNAKKQWVRNAYTSLRNENDEQLFASVKVVDAEGNEQRVYKETSVFAVEDCDALESFHKNRAEHHMDRSNWYARMKGKLTGKQMRLPFPDHQ